MIVCDKTLSTKIYSNDKFKKLEGYLGEKQAKVTLAEFLFNNLGVTTYLLTGWRLFPFQEIILRSWFDHNFNMAVWARGGSKSTLVSIFCCLYPLFFPGAKIVIASNSFRSTRRLIVQIEKIINGKGATLLKQCIPQDGKGKIKISHRNDEWCLDINGGHIKALPMNEKLRGERAEILICEEMLLIPEGLYKEVLLPFLASKSDIAEQLRIQEQEDALVISGNLTDEQRTVLESNKKIIGLTSASYDFEFVCKLYHQWAEQITNPNVFAELGHKYFLSRLSYKALPEELIDKEITELAKSGGEQTAAFQREFMANWSSSSDGFFNIKKLHQYTVKTGDLPCVQLKGNPNSKYILACDPNFNSSSTSDLFGICLYLLNDESRTITQVHSYGRPGGNLKDHLEYFYYLLTNFNVVFVIADLAGEGEGNNFISTANQSNLFSKYNLKLDFIEGDFDADDYAAQLLQAKNSYNQTLRRICYRQIFKSDWLRKANEWLQAQIEYGKIHFASNLAGHETMMDKAIKEYRDASPVKYIDNDGRELELLDFIGLQDELISQTKHQLALIEVKANPLGTLSFDIPQNLKRSKSPDRARRDLYTCMLMASWGAKCYWDMIYSEGEKPSLETFAPIILR